MSGHKRVKDVDYDDDDLSEGDDEYAYEGGENADQQQALSAEDEEQMAVSTVAVKEQLGSDLEVTVKEIQDALWYYYYDVEKSVAYLKKQHAPAEPKEKKKPQQKQVSRFDQAAEVAKSKPVTVEAFSIQRVQAARQQCARYLTAAEFFKDTPWLNVPPYRLGTIVVEPLHPRGGLLGGSSKPSKLAALAAARKKEREDKKKDKRQPEESVLGSGITTSSSALLSKLAVRKASSSEHATTSSLSDGQDTGEPSNLGRSGTAQDNSIQEAIPTVKPKPSQELQSADNQSLQMSMAPSSFARTILGGDSRLSTLLMRPHIVENSDGHLFTLNLNSHDAKDTKVNPFSGPSPDDVVLNAQRKGAKGAKATNGTNGTTTAKTANTNGISNGVAALKLASDTSSSSSRTQRKTIDVAAEYAKLDSKNAANFVVIGHVDHGKSTLMGRLLYDLKIVNQRSVDKLKREADNTGKSSFAYAWVMDSTPEERARGITVDIATNHFETANTRFTILDAPGHRDFIPNMIAGAAQADFAVLVIDASTNAYESGLRGQTKEHALLARSIGISRIVIAINKMDVAGWSEERFNEIRTQMMAFLQSAGFQSKNLSFVPCAGLTGENVATRPTSPGPMPWYNDGRCLIDALEACEPAARSIEERLRMTVGDIFRGGIQNPVSVSGRIDTGSLQVGDSLLFMPSGEKAHLKSIEIEGVSKEWAVAGQIPTLHLADIDPAHIRSGDIVCDPQRSPIQNIKTFTAKILAFEHMIPGALDVHRGRLHTPAQVSSLIAIIGKGEGEVLKKRPKVVKPGQVARVRVDLDSALPLETGARIVLRSEGQTLGAGLVESPPEAKNGGDGSSPASAGVTSSTV